MDHNKELFQQLFYDNGHCGDDRFAHNGSHYNEKFEYVGWGDVGWGEILGWQKRLSNTQVIFTVSESDGFDRAKSKENGAKVISNKEWVLKTFRLLIMRGIVFQRKEKWMKGLVIEHEGKFYGDVHPDEFIRMPLITPSQARSIMKNFKTGNKKRAKVQSNAA